MVDELDDAWVVCARFKKNSTTQKRPPNTGHPPWPPDRGRRIGVCVTTTEAARRQLMQPVVCWEKA